MSEERKSEVGGLVPLEVSWNAGFRIISGSEEGGLVPLEFRVPKVEARVSFPGLVAGWG